MSDDSASGSSNKLGRFVIKDDDDDEEDVITTGSLFAHRKDIDTPLRVPLKKPDSTEDTEQKQTHSNSRKEIDQHISKKRNNSGNKTVPLKNDNTPTTQNGSTKRIESKTSKKTKIKEPPIKKSKLIGKPFGQLLEGVVLVISGYQNPLRGNLRTMALEMGARYKADWDSTCTHLICAFPNTPKFQQVWGKGNIVRKEWVENCHSKRKRLPWRRYALDKRDLSKAESEDEIPELVQDSPPASPDRRSEDGCSLSGSDTEDEIEKLRAGKQHSDGTDVDSDSELPDTSKIPLPTLPNIFSGKHFYLSDELHQETKSKLHRYIVALDGTVSDKSESGEVNIVISEKKIKSKHTVVRPEWVWECNDADRLLPTKIYEI